MILILCLMLNLKSITSLPEKSCDRLKIDQNWYERKVLWTDLGRPYNLNIHKASNTLFFSYTNPETYSDVDFQIASYNMDAKEGITIAGIKGGCSVAIDQANDDIYLGGSEGIYKYNMMTKLADFYKEEGVNIWGLFYKKNLFYIRYPDQTLLIQIDGKFMIVKEFAGIEIDQFHIDSDNVPYFANKTGFYKFNHTISTVEVVTELISVRQITEDNNGLMYICTSLGIYINIEKEGLKRVLDLRNIYGLDFDRNNNLILSDEKSIIKLENSKLGCIDTKEHW